MGGRRWAKHSKYLNRLGVNTYVLTGEFPNSSSSWDDDIIEYKNNITRLPLDSIYKPYFETTLPKTLIEKIRWKLSYYSWQWRKKRLRGNYADASLPNRQKFLETAKSLIKEKSIATVILSVGPFAYSELLIDLKSEFPEVRYILDYRDPWEESISDLTPQQQKDELEKQLQVLKTIDLVLTVNDDISQKIRNINKNVKVITLPHCVDDDFLTIAGSATESLNNRQTSFVYGGELYGGMEGEMKTFVAFLDVFSEKAGKECDAKFYSPYPSYETTLNGKVDLKPMLLADVYKATLLKSDFILLFKSPLSSEAFFSSKFYEILCLRKPILFFGNKGLVPDFIELHKLGFHVRKDNLKEVSERIIENISTGQIPDRSYNLQQHSFEFHTKKLIEEIKLINRAV